MSSLQQEESPYYNSELHLLACGPQVHSCYSQCHVNGVKFVIAERDKKMKTQNSGVMVEAGDLKYYGILEEVIELVYPERLSVVVFKCKWFNTDPLESGNTKVDHGILSIDTSSTWYDEAPYCLAIHAKQVFYLNDPMEGRERWKIVNLVAHRGMYSANSLSRTGDDQVPLSEPYQEVRPRDGCLSGLHIDVLEEIQGFQQHIDEDDFENEDEDFDDEDDERWEESDNDDEDIGDSIGD